MKDNLSFENIGINGENISVSKWGYYCLVSAKVNDNSIFENESNIRRYLNGLCRNKNKSRISILAFCAMPDKLHIIFGQNTLCDIKKMLRSVNAGYATYSKFIMDKVKFEKTVFNIIDDEEKLRYYFKFICGLPINFRNYKWSSINKYLNNNWEYDELVDEDFIKNLYEQGGNSIFQIKSIVEEIESDNKKRNKK